ncbi:Chitin Synthase Export/Cell Fusion Regulator [Abortiporus biennis]
MSKSDSFTFTVGKLDAGMAILLGERAHLIEFPSLLLPPGATTGSIVNISVSQNHAEEKKRDGEFWNLQKGILEQYGTQSPEPPKLELRNVTQTSVTLEWPRLNLATAKLRSLDIYRNRQRLAAIPSPLTNTSTKLSGLSLDTEYTFQLVLRTTAGTFPSNVLRVRTHTMQDTSGISVCFGNVQDSVLLENSKMALREMGAKWSDKIQIDTTHFVCTTPAATPNGAQATGSISSAPGVEYQKALQLSIPVVQPHWILACHAEKKMVNIHPFYLGASSTSPMNSAPFHRPQSMSQANIPSPSRAPSSPTASTHAGNKQANRQSMPPPQRVTSTSPPASAAVRSAPGLSGSHQHKPIEPTPEEEGSDLGDHEYDDEQHINNETTDEEEAERQGRTRKGTMSKNFKFPPNKPEAPPPPVPALPSDVQAEASGPNPSSSPSPKSPPQSAPASKVTHETSDSEEVALTAPPPHTGKPTILTPSSVEVPPPPPVDKDKERSPIGGGMNDGAFEDLGETEEISLN